MRLTARFTLAALALALVVSIPSGFADPNKGWNLESRVSASALALVSFEDLGSWESKLEQAAIVKLMKDPEMQAFVTPLVEDLEAMITSKDAAGPFSELPPFAMEAFQQLAGLEGQLAVALLDFDFDSQMPTVVASLDFGAHVEDFVTFLTRLKAELGSDGEAIQTFERDGRVWWQVDTGGGPVISATTVDTAFVIGTDPEALQSVLRGPIEGSLAKDPDFLACRTKAGGSNLGLFAYANVPQILALVGDEIPPDIAKIANALGLDTVKGAAYGLAFVGDGFMDSIVIHTPGADHGLSTLDLASALRPKALALVPETAFYYAESAVPLGDLIPRVRTLIGAVDPDMVAQMEEGLEHVNQMLGVDVERELMAGFGTGMAFYAAMPETGGLYPEVAMMVDVKDPAAFEGVFGRFAQGVAGALTEQGDVIASTRTLEYRGQTLNLFEMQAARGDDVIPFTPTWTIKDGWLVVTVVPYSMKEMLLRTELNAGTAQAGLAGQEDFQSLMKVMPPEAGAIEYLDFQAIMNLLYDTGVPLLQTAVKPNMLPIPLRLDWAQLPPARSIRKYFRSFAAFTTWNRDGMAVQMHGPVPMVGVLAMVGGIAAVTFLSARSSAMDFDDMPMPGIIEVRPSDMDAELAEVQAQELLRYVRLFQLENERLPQSLQELVDAKVMRQIQKDPWGGDFKLEVTDGGKSYRVLSAGPDGAFKTEDDIVAGGD